MSDTPDDEEEDKNDSVLDSLDISGDAAPKISGDPPGWFTSADAQIIFIFASGLTLSPSILAENTEYSRQTASKRLNTLQAAEFVEKVFRGKYKVTKKGTFVVTADPDIYRDSDEESEAS